MKLFPGKLRSKWSGPYTVVCMLSYGVVEFLNKVNMPFLVNEQRVKHYYGADDNCKKEAINLANNE